MNKKKVGKKEKKKIPSLKRETWMPWGQIGSDGSVTQTMVKAPSGECVEALTFYVGLICMFLGVVVSPLFLIVGLVLVIIIIYIHTKE